MRRFLAIFLILAILIVPLCIGESGLRVFGEKISEVLNIRSDSIDNIVVNARAAILIDQDSGEVLFYKNANERMYPASTTKMLTALLAIELGDMNEVITVGDEVKLKQVDGSGADLFVGDKLTMSELIRGLMLPSGNDAAFVIAVNIARKSSGNDLLSDKQALKHFSRLMNDRCTKLGARNSNFINPDGYPHSNHFSTAKDLALIAREAMKHEVFRNVVKSDEYRFVRRNGSDSNIAVWVNKNELIDKRSKNYYIHATGIKTGHTSSAGHCLVSSAEKDGLNLIAVVLNSSEQGRWSDSKKLLEYGLENYKVHKLAEK